MAETKPEPAQVLIEPPFALPTGGGVYEFKNGALVPVELTNQAMADGAPAVAPAPARTGKAVALMAAPETPGA